MTAMSDFNCVCVCAHKFKTAVCACIHMYIALMYVCVYKYSNRYVCEKPGVQGVCTSV